MKLLFDQNLSHRPPGRLEDIFPKSAHVRLLGLDQAADEVIWEHAKRNGFCIVSLDVDFAERSRLYGAPPKVIWLRCGNSTAEEIESLLRQNQAQIAELSANPGLECLELS